MNPQDLKPNIIVRGPMFPEPVKVIRVVPMGGSIKLLGQSMNTGLVHQPILSPAQLANLEGSPEQQPFDGDATRFKLGVEALRLGIAYEYDPYSPCRLPGLIRCRTSLKQCTTISSGFPESGFFSPTIPALARRSWRACSSKN